MRVELKKLKYLIARNIKLYFKDKMTFFVSLITPLILIVLFITFLKNVYEESLLSCLPEGVTLSKRVINSFTGGWLFSSIMSVSCITVSFCSNMMVSDKINKTMLDFQISPVKKATIQTSYTISNAITTFIVCSVVLIISLIYLAIVGWYITLIDILMIFLNMILLVLFGSLLSSTIGLFLNSQGALSAVSTLVSSMYGFICGAYMPLAQFGSAMQGFVSFIPGTYATVLFRKFYMNGVLKEMGKTLPIEAINQIRDSFDGAFYFFGKEVKTSVMFLIVGVSTAVLFGLYLLLANIKKLRNKQKQNLKCK